MSSARPTTDDELAFPRPPPCIYVFSLACEDDQDVDKKPLFRKLHRRATAEVAQTEFDDPIQNLALIKDNHLGLRPHAIILTDDALARPEFEHVLGTVLLYVYTGGTLVVAAPRFGAFLLRDWVKAFFLCFGLEWDLAGRSSSGEKFIVSPDATGPAVGYMLPQTPNFDRYQMLRNVEPWQAWYRPETDAWLADLDASLSEEMAAVVDRVPVAFATVGLGRFGFLGNVCGQGAEEIALVMCGLADGQ